MSNASLNYGDTYTGPLEEGYFIPDSDCPGCGYQAEADAKGNVRRDHADRCPIATGISRELWALYDKCSDDPMWAAREIQRLTAEKQP